jgi:hypothetical protein
MCEIDVSHSCITTFPMEAITDGDKYQSVVSALKFHFLSLLFRKMTFDNTSALGLEDIEDLLEESGYCVVRLQE